MEEKLDKIILYKTSIKINDHNINEDGSYTMVFAKIFKGQNIIITINSNEMSRHNRPHVHACCNDKYYQISIDDKVEELNNKCDKYCRFIIKLCFRQEMQNFRKKWNSIISNYKFDIDKNGFYVCPFKI
ncbi:MAG: DUF4160 domain-containing protein [Clostridia bacterium]